ncbi:MAG: DUF554 domain-containing protein [Cyanobacteria bacterium P01_H01_bin.130]
MTLTLFEQLSGTCINVATVWMGTGLGLALRSRLPKRMLAIIPQGVGLITLLVGLEMARSLPQVPSERGDGIVIGLMALVVGGVLGEWWTLEDRLHRLGGWLKRKVQGTGRFTEGFVAASLLFCVGPMAILGSLNNGMAGDDRILVLKSTMDGFAAIALTGSFGIGVGFSSLAVLVYQGGLSLAANGLAQFLPDPATDPHVLVMTGIGGLTIVGIGINLLEIGTVRIASLLPALIVGPLFYAIAQLL